MKKNTTSLLTYITILILFASTLFLNHISAAELNKVGTVKLNIQDGTAKDEFNGGVNFFIPLYDANQSESIFLQTGHEYAHDESILSIGVGRRAPAKVVGFLAGINIFGDFNLENRQFFIGPGIELIGNNIAVSLNSHFSVRKGLQRLASMLRTPEAIAQQKQKKSDRWLDLTIAGYLPSFPKIGGKIAFEKHFTDKVSLLHSTTPQNKPTLLALEVSFTPIPLLTIVGNGQMTSASNPVIQVGIQFNYYLGAPFRAQIDGSRVAEMRSMGHNKHAFVPRNW